MESEKKNGDKKTKWRKVESGTKGETVKKVDLPEESMKNWGRADT